MGVDGYILVYSITSRNSFDRINQINESLLSALGDTIDIPRVLVGSMLDLSDQRQVTFRVSTAISVVAVSFSSLGLHLFIHSHLTSFFLSRCLCYWFHFFLFSPKIRKQRPSPTLGAYRTSNAQVKLVKT